MTEMAGNVNENKSKVKGQNFQNNLTYEVLLRHWTFDMGLSTHF